MQTHTEIVFFREKNKNIYYSIKLNFLPFNTVYNIKIKKIIINKLHEVQLKIFAAYTQRFLFELYVPTCWQKSGQRRNPHFVE